jgi:hypothetical protein
VPPSDPWLSRQNAALKLKGHGVTLDGAGARRHRLGVESFAWSPRLPKGRQRPVPQSEPAEEPQGISGLQAIRRTRKWCG